MEKRVLGEEHPDTLMTGNNLGCALIEQGKHADVGATFSALFCPILHFITSLCPTHLGAFTRWVDFEAGQ